MSAEDLENDSASDKSSVVSGADSSNKKRKRDDKDYEEIEVDVNAPEPRSKKALRRAKKGKPDLPTTNDQSTDTSKADDADEDKSTKRSDYGVWIGNLPWSAGKPELTKFMVDNAKISESEITRIHMPAPPKGKMDPSRQRLQPQNKGFAYVDFKTETACLAVIALSEKLLTGRRLLIKNSKSFEGRPDATEKAEKSANPPSKRIFVGNLAFDITEDDLKEHFAKCGQILSVFMATFEDSGQCKGYAWITFHEVSSAEKAVRGWVEMDQENSGSEDEVGSDAKKGKPKKPRKWWVNRMKGRSLRTEFAEEASLRYQKRYGKAKPGADSATGAGDAIVEVDSVDANRLPSSSGKTSRTVGNGDKKGPPRGKRVDARTVAPGAALSKAPRQSAAIVQPAGKKVTFD